MSSSDPKGVDDAKRFERLGSSYCEIKKYEDAKEYYLKALEIYETVLGPEDLCVANCLIQLGMTCSYAGQIFKAKEYFEKGLDILKKSANPSLAAVATTYSSLGVLHESAREYDKAKEFYEKYSKTMKNLLNPEKLEDEQNQAKTHSVKEEPAAQSVEKLEDLQSEAKTHSVKKKPAAQSVDDVPSDDTELNGKEIFFLSREIGENYVNLGRLTELSADVELIRANNQFPGPQEKAARLLDLINNKQSFSRKKLAECLDKINLGRLGKKLVCGKLQ